MRETTWRVRVPTPVGEVSAAGDAVAVRRTGWRIAGPEVNGGSPLAVAARQQLGEYFAGRRTSFDLPLDLSVLSAASSAVLRALCTVPYGDTLTYAELARRSGCGVPPRGIGSVMRTNPVPLLVPCHRVVAADGLGGFSGGDPGRELVTKRWLLELEGALPAGLVSPLAS